MAGAVENPKRSNQQQALLKALRAPRTVSELLIAMRDECPKVQLRDIWRLLSKLQKRGLAYCLTPKEVTGRIYFFTEKGRASVGRAFNISVKPPPTGINWKTYSEVVRGRARTVVLLAMEHPWKSAARTMAEIRRLTRNVHPLCMSAAIRAVHDLQRLKLIQQAGVTEKRARPLFIMTGAGKRILEQMNASGARFRTLRHQTLI